MNMNLILYLLALVIMGSNGIVAHFINLTSIEIVFMRTIIGSIVLILVCIAHKEKFICLRNKKDATFVISSGLALGAGWIFLFEAYRLIGVGIATMLYYIGPMLAMLLSPIFFKEKLTKVKVIGAIIVFAGVMFLIDWKSINEANSISGALANEKSQMEIYGIICGLLSGVLYAVMVILNKNVKSASGLENTTCQVVASFFLIAVFMLFTGGIHIHIKGAEWIPVLWIGLINTGVSCFFYYSTITKLPISTVAIFSYLDPVSAVVLSVLILGETLTLFQIIGVVCVIGGAAFSQLYKSR